ncbi:ATP-binding protein [Athalassotoga saccharophila]|uniref:ATP-binding protein n=1 Tax=Athalassotoga saccharophila TaxID=1441386 RepID=UPI001379FECF|nr:ATP-binding protein [Athalassotoga saccharophila]BBJ27952.1 signal transduction histidine-protein kinase AtoS [Athalassotoga saccharophila]
MRTIADHILDIAQNSVNAGAKEIEIKIKEDDMRFEFEILDDGCGMDEITLSKVFDPFFTTKHKKTGLGLPLLKEYAELTGGYVKIESMKGKGTKIKAEFKKTIDCQPIGDLAGTLATLVLSSNTKWHIERSFKDKSYIFSSEDIKGDLTNPKNMKIIFEYFKRLEDSINGKSDSNRS